MNFKPTGLAILFLSGIMALTACAHPSQPSETDPADPQITAYREYLQMLTDGASPDVIEEELSILLIDLNSGFHEPMILAYEAYLKSSLAPPEEPLEIALIDYARINRFKEYLSPEQQSYYAILESEYRSMDLNAPVLSAAIPNLLEKAVQVETHLLTYKEGQTMNKSYEFYARYLYRALLANGLFTELMAPDSSKLREDITLSYRDFIAAHPASRTASLVAAYLDIIEENQGNLTAEAVQDFYFNFYSYLRSYLWDNRSPEEIIT